MHFRTFLETFKGDDAYRLLDSLFFESSPKDRLKRMYGDPEYAAEAVEFLRSFLQQNKTILENTPIPNYLTT